MNLNEVRTMAKKYGIPASKLSTVDLIRYIQHHEGNFDCFATAHDGVCDQVGCRWRDDCFNVAKQGGLS